MLSLAGYSVERLARQHPYGGMPESILLAKLLKDLEVGATVIKNRKFQMCCMPSFIVYGKLNIT